MQLDVLGVLLTVLVLGPRYWRWTLMAMCLAWGSTLIVLIFGRMPLVAYTLGGVFNQVELQNAIWRQGLASLTGPLACYSFVRLRTDKPLGTTGVLTQLMPWSSLERPLEGTLFKYACLSALVNLATILSWVGMW